MIQINQNNLDIRGGNLDTKPNKLKIRLDITHSTSHKWYIRYTDYTDVNPKPFMTVLKAGKLVIAHYPTRRHVDMMMNAVMLKVRSGFDMIQIDNGCYEFTIKDEILDDIYKKIMAE